MRRLAYIGLATLLTVVPVGGLAQYAATTPAATSMARTEGTRYHAYHSNYYYLGGGHGGWLGNSYGWGSRGYDYDRGSSGSARYRSGGPGGGGK